MVKLTKKNFAEWAWHSSYVWELWQVRPKGQWNFFAGLKKPLYHIYDCVLVTLIQLTKWTQRSFFCVTRWLFFWFYEVLCEMIIKRLLFTHVVTICFVNTMILTRTSFCIWKVVCCLSTCYGPKECFLCRSSSECIQTIIL